MSSMRPLRVLLADDHRLIRDLVTRLLKTQPDIEVVGDAADGRQALQRAEELQPDVVLMDVSMPLLDGIEATRLIRAALPGVRVIGFSTYDEPEVRQLMMEAGAETYLVKGGPCEALFAALRGGRRLERLAFPRSPC